MNQPENENKYLKVQENEIKNYFDKDDKTEPAEYYYQSRVLGDNKDKKGNGGKLRSVTVKEDNNNSLNKRKNIGQMFGDKDKKGIPTYYYTKVLGGGKNKPENMQIYPAQGDTNMDDIYNNIKSLGGISNNPDDEGIQLIKVYGKVDPSEIGKHIQQSENIIDKNEPNKDPASYYFENKVLGDNKSGEPGIKVDSVTIKRDPNNDLNKGKDIETVFKEGEEDEDKDKNKDLGEPTYYIAKVKGGIITKPEDVQLIKATGSTKMDDVNDQLKKMGPVDKHDGIQLFKVCGDVNTKNL